LIDNDASHNSLKEDVATILGMQIFLVHVSFKAINSEDKNVIGMTRDVPINIGHWNGKIEFTIIHFDDYDVLLGKEFLIRERDVPLSHFSVTIHSFRSGTCDSSHYTSYFRW